MIVLVTSARAFVVFQIATMTSVMMVMIKVAPTTNSTISVPLASL
jgi:hypothetical protein